MTEWKMLKIGQTSDYESINSAFAAQALMIVPDRNSSEYRRLYTTYKEALRYASRENAVKEGRRAEDLDFDFRDDRYLDEFMRILKNISGSGLKQMLPVWKSLIDDSDYRTLQRTDTFIAEFDRYMSQVSGLDADIWKYLIDHFKVYGFSAQNKKLIADLQKYGNIKEDVFIKNDILLSKSPSQPKGTQQKQRMQVPEARTEESRMSVKTAGDIRTVTQGPDTRRPARQASPVRPSAVSPVQSAASRNTGNDRDPLLEKYMEMQDDSVVDELSTDFFKKFGRVYSHEITKNNLSAWRYLMQDPKYTYLLRQARFTEKIANSLRYVNDLYPAIWEYIIDKTKVPKNHPMYQKTTGELLQLMKKNKYSGEIMPQGVIQTEYLRSIIDEDNFTKGHHDYPQSMTQGRPAQGVSAQNGQGRPVRNVPVQNRPAQGNNTYKNNNGSDKGGSQKTVIIVIIIFFIILRILFMAAF